MKLNFSPQTYLGKWSAKLIAIFTLFITTFYGIVALGYRGGDTFFSQPALTIPILIAAICGVTAFLTGLLSIVKNKERSSLVILSTLIGLFVLIFILGEILTPH